MAIDLAPITEQYKRAFKMFVTHARNQEIYRLNAEAEEQRRKEFAQQQWNEDVYYFEINKVARQWRPAQRAVIECDVVNQRTRMFHLLSQGWVERFPGMVSGLTLDHFIIERNHGKSPYTLLDKCPW